MSEQPVAQDTLITLTADIVAAHVSNNSVSVGDLPQLIANVHQALTGLGTNEPETPKLEPAVSIRASVKPDYIVCLEDGKKLKMLKRHLMTHYQMTPADYRAKWGLPADYPMVAPSYAATRKELAHKIGLGRKPKAAAPPLRPRLPARAKPRPSPSSPERHAEKPKFHHGAA
jgi:predicted transcriptional regulator